MLAAEKGAAIIGAVLIGALAVTLYILQRRRKQEREPSTNSDALTSPPRLYTEDARHALAERSFWNRQIIVATWLNIITGIAACVGIATLVLVREQVIDAKEATIRANRAWLLLDDPSYTISKSPSGVETIDPMIAIHNIGKEPATDVRLYTNPFLVPISTHQDEVGRMSVDMRTVPFPRNNTCLLVHSQTSLGVVWA
jgi:hypothetical protein